MLEYPSLSMVKSKAVQKWSKQFESRPTECKNVTGTLPVHTVDELEFRPIFTKIWNIFLRDIQTRG